MSIEWFRDLVIVIGGAVLLIVLIIFTLLVYSLYRRTRTILATLESTIARVQKVSSYAESEVAHPLFQVASLIQGIYKIVDTFSSRFKKGGGHETDGQH